MTMTMAYRSGPYSIAEIGKHREAHYGRDAAALEEAFLDKLRSYGQR